MGGGLGSGGKLNGPAERRLVTSRGGNYREWGRETISMSFFHGSYFKEV